MFIIIYEVTGDFLYTLIRHNILGNSTKRHKEKSPTIKSGKIPSLLDSYDGVDKIKVDNQEFANNKPILDGREILTVICSNPKVPMGSQ